MVFSNQSNINTKLQHKGFTLIELVVVIIIIGILSVTVLPKFFSSKGFEEYTYRTEIISTLRAVQLRAMQQSESFCVGMNSTHLGVVWDNTNQRITASSPDCTTPFIFNSVYAESESDTLEVKVESNHSVTFTMARGTLPLTFDNWGRPNSCPNNGCLIEITGSDTLSVVIESQGYIHD